MNRLYQIYINTFWAPALIMIMIFILSVVLFRVETTFFQLSLMLYFVSLLTWFLTFMYQFNKKNIKLAVINLILFIVLGGITLNMIIHSV